MNQPETVRFKNTGGTVNNHHMMIRNRESADITGIKRIEIGRAHV